MKVVRLVVNILERAASPCLTVTVEPVGGQWTWPKQELLDRFQTGKLQE
jgi:hypothetical protein